jgi:lysyl-tRNA synthetase class II
MQPPRPESRISSLEKRATTIEAQIAELSSDTAEELTAIRQDNKELFAHIQKGFDQAHAYIDENMATKEDIAALKGDLVVLKGDLAVLKGTQGEHSKKLDEHSVMLRQILQLLQPKGD